MNDTLARLNDVFREVFDDDELIVSRATSAKDVPGWDSLTQVTLMLNVEKAFRVRFTSSEVSGLTDVGELVDLIESKCRP